MWIDSAIGGFHDYNEANYTLIAKNFLGASLLFPNPDGHLFLETPPFYAYLLTLLFRFTGVSVLAARLFAVASSLALIVSTFLLGRHLYGERAGLVAAVLLAVSPLAVLTGRNIQTDTLLLFLLVTALLFYLRATSGSTRDWLRFGTLFGVAIFTKLFAVIVLPPLLLWELVANRGERTLAKKGLWQALGVAAILPAAFCGFHALRDFAYLRQQLTGGAAVSTTFPTSAVGWTALSLEALWAFSPVVALLLAAGVGAAAWKVTFTRLHPGGAVIVISTRWHEDDLARWLVREHSGEGWEVVSLPALAEPGDLLGRAEGEALWPERFPVDVLGRIRAQLGGGAFAALYQQRPAALKGSVFKREWWKFYREAPQFQRVVLSLDSDFKAGRRMTSASRRSGARRRTGSICSTSGASAWSSRS